MAWPIWAIMLLFCLIISSGLIIWLIAIWRGSQPEFSSMAIARIVKIETASNEFDEPVFYPVMEFDFNQQTYVVKSQIGYNKPPFERGDNVTVWFEPEHPENASLQRYQSRN